MQKIIPFLWFDKEAREAAKFYTSVFKDSKMKTPESFDGTPSGTIDIVNIELFGQDFMLMSAGPHFKINEAISFIINCENQEEVDYYWEKLSCTRIRAVRLVQRQIWCIVAGSSKTDERTYG